MSKLNNENLVIVSQTKLEQIFPKKKKFYQSEKQYVFLAGAGISINPPSNLPSSEEIIKNIVKNIYPEEELEFIIACKYIRFEMIIDLTKSLIDPSIKFMNYLEEINTPNLIHYFLAERIINDQLVLTTNFDYMIEKALINSLPETEHKNIFLVITQDDYLECKDLEKLIKKGKHLLFKIHGSKKNILTGKDTKESLITTISSLTKLKNENYRSVYQGLGSTTDGDLMPIISKNFNIEETTFKIEDFKESTFEQILKNRILVILGFSGRDSFDINPTLKAFESFSKLVWIKHSRKTKCNSLKIFVPNRKNLNTKNINQIERDDPDRLFLELALKAKKEKKSIDFYLIEVNTLDFIEKFLRPYFATDRKSPCIDKRQNNLDFENWMTKILISPNSLEKYWICLKLYMNLGLIDKSFEIAQKGLKKAKDGRDSKREIDFLNCLGELHQLRNKLSKAFSLFNEAKNLAKVARDSQRYAECLNNIGNHYFYIDKRKKAEYHYRKALNIGLNENNKKTQIESLHNLGVLYKIGKLGTSLKMLDKALHLSEISGDIYNKALSFFYLAGYFEPKRFIIYMQKAKRLCEEIGYLQLLTAINKEFARFYMSFSDYEKARELLMQTLEICETMDYYGMDATVLRDIGLTYLEQKKMLKAKIYFQKSLKIAEKLDIEELQDEIKRELSKIS